MTKLLVVIVIFSITLGALWFTTDDRSITSTPTSEIGAASIFLQSGPGNELPTQTQPAPTQTPTSTPTPSETLTQKAVNTISPSVTPKLPSPTLSGTFLPTPTTRPTPSTTPMSSPSDTPTSMPSHESTLSITSLTNPVAQKQDAKIVIQSQPSANCTIEVTWPSGSISTSKDLAPKNADQNGEVVWIWGVNWNTKPGTATIKLSCNAEALETSMQVVASP